LADHGHIRQIANLAELIAEPEKHAHQAWKHHDSADSPPID
jgi:hypothetical protein